MFNTSVEVAKNAVLTFEIFNTRTTAKLFIVRVFQLMTFHTASHLHDEVCAS